MVTIYNSRKHIIYVGDNAAKDGVAPKKIGMNFVQLLNKEGIYNKY